MDGSIDSEISYTDGNGTATASLMSTRVGGNASLSVHISALDYQIDEKLSVSGNIDFLVSGERADDVLKVSSYRLSSSSLEYTNGVTASFDNISVPSENHTIELSVSGTKLEIRSATVSINVYKASGDISISYNGTDETRVDVSDVLDNAAADGGGNETAYSGGYGTYDSPYLISTSADLDELREAVNSGNTQDGVHFLMTNDIRLTVGWMPIGTARRVSSLLMGNTFNGIFDGGNHVVSGLSIKEGSSSIGNAFISGIRGEKAVVKNLAVEGNIAPSDVSSEAALVVCFITDGASVENCIAGTEGGDSSVTAATAAGVVGRIIGSGKALGCKNYADITGSMTTGDKVGGVVSTAYYPEHGTATISDCKNYGTIKGDRYIGGVVGFTKGSDIDRCFNYGEVYAATNSGGVVGQLGTDSSVSDSENHGKIYVIDGVLDGYYGNIGGIVGYSLGGTKNEIVSCSNYAPISTDFTSASDARVAHLGGIAGYSDSTLAVKDCRNYENGTVTIPDNNKPGTNTSSGGAAGIVGCLAHAGTIECCYNDADISSPEYTAGILGSGGDEVTILNSENYGDIDGLRSYHGGITGKIASGKIEECINTGNVTVTGTDTGSAGGIVGSYDGSTKVDIISCVNGVEGDSEKGKVTTNYHAGGIAGGAMEDGSTISESINYGTVSGGYIVGGLVSETAGNNEISESHNYGDVIANNSRNSVTAGGIIGFINRIDTGLKDHVIIKDVTSSGKLTIENTGSVDIGGIFGESSCNAEVVNADSSMDIVFASGTASSQSRVGGIAGYIYESTGVTSAGNSTSLIDCDFTGTVPDGCNSVVGLQNSKAQFVTITNCTGPEPTGMN